MATNTTKLALTKPDGTDLVDIAVLNANADKIDAASGATICTSTTRPTSPWNGQLIFETDTLNVLVYRTSTSSWSIVGGSTVSSAPPAGAGNGNFWWDSDNGILYIYYNDGNSSQWVSVMPSQTTVEVSQNYVINGAFDVWQRGTSTTTAGFLADRWQSQVVGGSAYTQSRQSLDAGVSQSTTSGEFYYRHQHTAGTGAGDYGLILTRIEDVRTLANKTVTFSFWATADSTRSLSVEFSQYFGSGGSATVNSIGVTKLAVTTNVTRYTVTVTLPSVSGKTINSGSFLEILVWFDAGSNFNSRTNSLGHQSGAYTFNVWGFQLESGSIATSFRRSSPNMQAELAACQRYYKRWNVYANGYVYMGGGGNVNTTTAQFDIQHQMRTGPTAVEFVNSQIYRYAGISVTGTASIYAATETNTLVRFACPAGSYTATPEILGLVGSTGGYIALSAEL